jgi:hypothetical protein
MNPAQIPPPKNAEERAMRRCVSSGRLAATCAGNGLLGAFTQIVSQVLPGADKKPQQPGPNMAGVFEGAGHWRLDFIDEGVLVNCAELSPNQELQPGLEKWPCHAHYRHHAAAARACRA